MPERTYERQKRAREKNGKQRINIDLSLYALDLLARTSRDQNVPRPALLELMIRRYCEPPLREEATAPRRRNANEF
jgi:hypothetical protein